MVIYLYLTAKQIRQLKRIRNEFRHAMQEAEDNYQMRCNQLYQEFEMERKRQMKALLELSSAD